MTFSYKVISDVLNFFLNNTDPQTGLADNFETMLQACDTQYNRTIDRLVGGILLEDKPNEVYPKGYIYEVDTGYVIEELQRVIKQYRFKVEFAVLGSDLTRLRMDLYSYRDAITTLIEKYKDLNGACNIVQMTAINPPLLMWKDNNFKGYIDCSFTVDIY